MLANFFKRPAPKPAQPPEPSQLETDVADLDKQVKRLAKELFKTNTLAESQMEQTRQAVELMKASLAELQSEQKSNKDAIQAVRVDAVKVLFPVIDSIESGVRSGTM